MANPDTVTIVLESVFPADPPRFMARTPHGYHDRATIERELAGPLASHEWMGDEIWEQAQGQVTAFVQSVGTCGSLAAALRIAARLGPERTVATVACDSGMKYLSTALYAQA